MSLNVSQVIMITRFINLHDTIVKRWCTGYARKRVFKTAVSCRQRRRRLSMAPGLGTVAAKSLKRRVDSGGLIENREDAGFGVRQCAKLAPITHSDHVR